MNHVLNTGRCHLAQMPRVELTFDQVVQRVRRLAADGHGDHAIADVLGLHVDQVRAVLAQRGVCK
jgi:hypothetical protein